MKAYCIYGPPGTGKTSELVRMLKWVLDKDTHDSTVFVSHTRAAATEAVSRLTGTRIPRDNVSTIHSLCFRLCDMSSAQVVDYTRLRQLGAQLNIRITGRSPDADEMLEEGDEFLALYSLARCSMRAVDDIYDESDRPGDRARFHFFVKSYEAWKDSHGYLDFNDMLFRYLAQGRKAPFESYIIDEAQDLSPLQWAVLRKMTEGARYVVFAGDDDQSIYGWGGADPGGMPRFEAELGATRKVLDQSYRVPHAVHAVAQSVIHRVKARVDKPYRARDFEGRVKRAAFFNSHDALPGDLCLYRNHAFREHFEVPLFDAGVAYLCEGGRPAPLQTRWGKLLKNWRARDPEITAMGTNRGFLTQQGVLYDEQGKLFELPWHEALAMPHELVGYFRRLEERPAQEPVRLSTIHTAKGREANNVFLDTSLTQRTGTHDDSDDEHRVFYVGITRAKETLTILDGVNGYRL